MFPLNINIQRAHYNKEEWMYNLQGYCNNTPISIEVPVPENNTEEDLCLHIDQRTNIPVPQYDGTTQTPALEYNIIEMGVSAKHYVQLMSYIKDHEYAKIGALLTHELTLAQSPERRAKYTWYNTMITYLIQQYPEETKANFFAQARVINSEKEFFLFLQKHIGNIKRWLHEEYSIVFVQDTSGFALWSLQDYTRQWTRSIQKYIKDPNSIPTVTREEFIHAHQSAVNSGLVFLGPPYK